MSRYISFVDILGFSELINNTPIQDVIHRLSIVCQNTITVEHLGVNPLEVHPQILNSPQVKVFSFSDTFVIASSGSTPDDFHKVISATVVLTTHLFGMSLPSRGAITLGEAEYIPGTNHLVGKAIIRAHQLERNQDWFGTIIDPDILDKAHMNVLEHPLLKPVVVEYEVPFKSNCTIQNPCRVINWRFNMGVEKGIRSLFRPSLDKEALKKIDNTLQFCKWIRENKLDKGHYLHPNGTRMYVPWLRGLWVGQLPPDNPKSIHGDEF